MSAEFTDNQILDLLPAYILGALEAEEMLAIDTYIQQRQALLARLRHAEQLVAHLAHAAPAAPRPVEARERLMARVRTELVAQNVGAAVVESISPAAIESSQKPVPISAKAGEEPTRFLSSFGPLSRWAIATGGALVLLAIITVYALQTQRQLRQLVVQLDGLQAELVELRQINEVIETRLRTNQNQLALIANAGARRIVQVPPTTEGPENAEGRLYVINEQRGLLELRGLEPLSGEQTYQLWLALSPDDGPVSARLVEEVYPDGSTWVDVQIPPNLQEFTIVGVSLEPAGGSPRPTKIVLLGSQS